MHNIHYEITQSNLQRPKEGGDIIDPEFGKFLDLFVQILSPVGLVQNVYIFGQHGPRTRFTGLQLFSCLLLKIAWNCEELGGIVWNCMEYGH